MNSMWKNHFSSIILQRGADYYETGCVGSLNYEDNVVTAEVYGTSDYFVEITLNKEKNNIEDAQCCCPYAEDGRYCKHMAAVMFSIEYDENVVKDTEPKQNLESMIQALSEENAKQILLEYAKKDKGLRDKIVLSSALDITEAQIRIWEKELNGITWKYSRRDGYIDYYSAYDYTSEIISYINKRVPLMLEKGLYKAAFRLTALLYDEVYSVDMDDSDGELTVIDSICMDYWREAIEQADAETRIKMYEWFEAGSYDGALFDLMTSSFDDKELLERSLIMIDEKIDQCDEDDDYIIEAMVIKKYDIMHKLNMHEEVNEFKEKYHSLFIMRKREFSELISSGKFKEAIALANESKEIDKENYNHSHWSKALIFLYNQINDKEKYKEELIYFVFNCHQRNLEYVDELKDVSEFSQWEIIREKLLKSPSMSSVMNKFLCSEKQYDRLLKRIISQGNIYELFSFEEVLKQHYPNELCNIILQWVDKEMSLASDRNKYQKNIAILKKLLTYPDGKIYAKNMAQGWKRSYPRRRAMLDELKKAGF